MGDDLTFDQLWVAGDDEDTVHGQIELGDVDEDAVILENPSEEMRKPEKRKLGALQSGVAATRVKHAPKQRIVPLTEDQILRRKQKLEKLKSKRARKSGSGGAKKAGGGMLQVLAESAAKQAEYFWSEYCASLGGDLTIAEIEDPLPGHGVHPLGNIPRHAENICQCVEKLYPKRSAKFKSWTKKNKPASPLILIVCMSARRCVQLLKHLAKYKNVVAKLFAKRIKLAEQITALQEQKFALALGTPNRIRALADAGALNLDRTTHVVLDCTYLDPKQRTIFDEPATRKDVMLLYREHLHDKAKQEDSRLKLVLF